MKPSNYFLMFVLLSSCKPNEDSKTHVDHSKEKGAQWEIHGSGDHPSGTRGTNRPPTASGSTEEIEHLFLEVTDLETAALSKRVADPVDFLVKVKNIPYPSYDLANAPMREKIINICRTVGEVQSLPVIERMEYILKSLPLEITPGVVDDMIRGMDAEGLDGLNTWLANFPKGREKNEIYYVIGQRLKNLGLTPEEIQVWAKKASSPEETKSILQAL